MAALLSVVPGAQAQTAPTNTQLLDKLLATAKPGDKFVKNDDMLLSVEKLRAYRNQNAGRQTSGTRQASSAFYQTTFWPGGVVYYVIDPSLQPTQRNLFVQAAREWEGVARLKFIPRTNQVDYIRVFRDAGDPNYSNIGKVGGEQLLSLGVFSNLAVAEHEIAHALGVMHEQSRSNRDTFVSIDFTNIVVGQENNFAIVTNSNNRSAYDFDSVMHYGQFDFAVDRTKPTIITKPGFTQFQNSMGQRDHLSVSDKKGMVDIYGAAGPLVIIENDNFAQAKVIEGPAGTVEGTNVATSHEVGEDNHAGSLATSSVWYRWRPVNNGTVTFNTKGSSFNTVLAVYLGLSVSTLTPVVSNDDSGALSPDGITPDVTSSVSFPAQAGAFYYIAVDSSITDIFGTGDTGAISLNWNQNEEATRFKISGVVKTSTSEPVLGAQIRLVGADTTNSSVTFTVATNASGEYTISNLLAGNYNLTASKSGFTLTPSPLKVNLTANSGGNNFIATPVPFKISGSVKNSASVALSGVLITLKGADTTNSSTTATATTNAAGEYTLSSQAGNYNLTASKAGFTFTPNPLKVTLTASTTGKNFVGAETQAAELPEMYVSDVSIREGKSGSSFVTFNISMSMPSKESVSVSYATANGSATSGSDYNATNGTLIFAAGRTTMTVSITIRPDSVVEDNETFAFNISNAAGARIVDAQGIATLINDDAVIAGDASSQTAKAGKTTRLAMLDSMRP